MIATRLCVLGVPGLWQIGGHLAFSVSLPPELFSINPVFFFCCPEDRQPPPPTATQLFGRTSQTSQSRRTGSITRDDGHYEGRFDLGKAVGGSRYRLPAPRLRARRIPV